MKVVKTFLVTTAVLFISASAFAQHAQGGHRGAGVAGHAAVPRASMPAMGRVARPAGIAPRVYGPGPRATTTAPRTVYSQSRVYAGRGPVVGRAVPRAYAPRVAPRIVTVAPVRFYQPYYVFRPRVSLGFGLWVGFPIAYPAYLGYYYPYYAPYPYPVYAPYPYPAYPEYPATYPPPAYPPAVYPSGSVGVQPGVQTNTGGVSFEITPATAEVWVDGAYVGTVGQFTPTSQPLGLTPGRHHIEIRAPGYQTMVLDADIVPGQVIPYQGAMQR